jgi:hypothetical protein
MQACALRSRLRVGNDHSLAIGSARHDKAVVTYRLGPSARVYDMQPHRFVELYMSEVLFVLI